MSDRILVFASTTPRAVIFEHNAGSTFEDGMLENTKLGKVDVLVMPRFEWPGKCPCWLHMLACDNG